MEEGFDAFSICKAERKTATFHILHLALEDGFKVNDAFNNAFLRELNSFMVFNNCTTIQLHKTTPSHFKKVFQKTLTE